MQTPAERGDAATQRRLTEALALTRRLGGVPVELKGDDLATTVAEYARQTVVTHVLVGRSRRGWLTRLLRRGPLDRLLTYLPGVDVLVWGSNGRLANPPGQYGVNAAANVRLKAVKQGSVSGQPPRPTGGRALQ